MPRRFNIHSAKTAAVLLLGAAGLVFTIGVALSIAVGLHVGGVSYWQGLLDWIRASMLPEAKIGAADLDLIHLTDDVEEIVSRIEASVVPGS